MGVVVHWYFCIGRRRQPGGIWPTLCCSDLPVHSTLTDKLLSHAVLLHATGPKYIALPVTAVPLSTLAYPVVWLHWRSLISFRIIFVIAVVEYLVRNNLRSKRFVLAYGLKVHCSGKDVAVIEGPAAAQGSRRLLTWFLSWWTRKQKDGISGSQVAFSFYLVWGPIPWSSATHIQDESCSLNQSSLEMPSWTHPKACLTNDSGFI